MNILLTGAFGNIGLGTLEGLLERGHWVRCFDLPTKTNRKAAQNFLGRTQVHWGDLRNLDDVREAMGGVDVVVHLAFVIPNLSATGVSSESEPEWAYAINVGGTKHILRAMREQDTPPKLLFSSSLHIYGRTQHIPPPREVSDPPDPIEHYAKHKVECEQLIMGSGLTWCILRLGASLPVRLVLDAGMFEVPLDNRIEFVHNKDVGTAIANALESDKVWGKILHVGGGVDCQLYQRELVEAILEEVGVGMLPDDAFTDEPYPTDWLDTTESQRLLQFQQRTLKDYLVDLRSRLGFRRVIIRIFRPLIRSWILSRARARAR
jgi:nucleoside-diphosphate-sugar epimerase